MASYRSTTNKFLYFDLGNVLVTFDPHIAARRLAEAADCSLQHVLQTVFSCDLQQRYETGLVSDEQYAEEISSMLGTQLSTQSVMHAICAIFQPNQPILQVLQQVQRMGIPMGILSNTCDAHWQWLMQQDWPMLHGWFEHRVLSYQVGSMKPNRRIYEVCEEVCGLQGSQIFFTDDLEKNIAAAAQRGWTTCQFRSTDELTRSLQAWLEAD
ncbi:MAG: HAD family phosphatase [Pirellulaceae bacterium]|nr:HAD family phosphatase [Pirellulaceae bacterium]